jgi:hypothetical protein
MVARSNNRNAATTAVSPNRAIPIATSHIILTLAVCVTVSAVRTNQRVVTQAASRNRNVAIRIAARHATMTIASFCIAAYFAIAPSIVAVAASQSVIRTATRDVAIQSASRSMVTARFLDIAAVAAAPTIAFRGGGPTWITPLCGSKAIGCRRW